MSSADHYVEVERLELAGRNLEERRLGANILCGRCRRGIVQRRRGKLEVLVFCHAINRRVPPDIVECNGFEDVKKMDLDDMTRLAVVIDVREGVHRKSYI